MSISASTTQAPGIELEASVAKFARDAASGAYSQILRTRLNRWLPVAGGAGLLLVGLERVFGALLGPFSELSSSAGGLGACLVGLAPSVLILMWVGATTRRPAARDAVVEADARLGLRDRVASAVRLTSDGAGGSRVDEGFAQLVAEAAVRAAAASEARDGFGRVPATRAVVGLVLVGGAVALGFAPRLAWGGAGPADNEGAMAGVSEEQAEEREAAAEALDQVVDEFGETASTTGIEAVDARVQRTLDELRALEQELAAGEGSADDVRRRAAAELRETSDALERVAERQERRDEAWRRETGGLSSGVDERVRGLAEALEAGDFAQAAAEAERLQGELLGESARAEAAESLRELAEALRPQPAEDDAEPSSVEQLGLDDETEQRLLDEEDRDAVAESLEDQGLPRRDAERLAEQITEENLERRAREQARDRMRELSESLEDEADRLEENEASDEAAGGSEPDSAKPDSAEGDSAERAPSPRMREGQQDGGPSSAAGASGEPSGDPSQDESDDNQTGGDQPGDGSSDGQSPSQSPGQAPDDTPSGDGSGESSDSTPSTPGDPGGTPGAAGGEPGTPGGGGKGGESSGSPSGQPPGQQLGGEPSEDGVSPGSDSGGQPGGQPSGQSSGERSDAPGASPGGEAGRGVESGDGGQGDGGQGVDRAEGRQSSDASGSGQGSGRGFAEQLRDIASEPPSAGSQDLARRLRERSDQLLSEATPEELEEARRLANALAAERSSAWSGRTELFDARSEPTGPSESDRVIGRWFGDGDAGRGVSREGFNETVRDAARGAERAIEENAVPPRHTSLIRRVFESYVSRQGEGGAEAVDDASDAGDE
ncbi:MAG: hypothetical protein AAF108_03220 [Planctomycetota bacterium]